LTVPAVVALVLAPSSRFCSLGYSLTITTVSSTFGYVGFSAGFSAFSSLTITTFSSSFGS